MVNIKKGKKGLLVKIKWLSDKEDEETWEPIQNITQESLQELLFDLLKFRP